MYLYAKIIHEQSQNTSLNISLEQWVFQNMLVVVIDVGYTGNLFYLMYCKINDLVVTFSKILCKSDLYFNVTFVTFCRSSKWCFSPPSEMYVLNIYTSNKGRKKLFSMTCRSSNRNTQNAFIVDGSSKCINCKQIGISKKRYIGGKENVPLMLVLD